MATQRVSQRTKSEARSRSANESGERESAGFRAALPSLDVPAAPTHNSKDAELEQKLIALVTAVSNNDGMTFPPEWLTVADAAKRRGLLNETNLRLFLTDTGRQWLAIADAPAGPRVYTMTKIDPHTRLALKDLARETGMPMQEAITHIVDAVHANRDALTRAARAQGLTYPWEAIGKLVKGR